MYVYNYVVCCIELETCGLNKFVYNSNLAFFFVQSLHEKKMADNEKKFEIRLDQQRSEITAQVTNIWPMFNDEMSYYINVHEDHTSYYKYEAYKLGCHLCIYQAIAINEIL